MAQRPVYVPGKNGCFATTFTPEFTWNGGFAVSQKQKNIDALHAAFNRRFPDKKVLEISSKSRQELGIKLSAFNLKKYIPSLKKSIPLECAFQGGKIFSDGGPYTDLYEATPRDAKRDPRLKSGGRLLSFYFEEKEMPLFPKTAFYDWLYINALMENPELAEQVLEYDAFTDIEFNPEKSINCQAKAAALFVAISDQGLLEQCKDFETFAKLVR